METIDLIQTLAKDVKATKQLRPPSIRLIGWIFVSAVVISAWILILGARPDLPLKLREFRFVAETSLLFVGSILSAFLALVVSIPNSNRSRSLKFITLLPIGLWAVALFTILIRSYFEKEAAATTPGLGLGCVRALFFIGTVPMLVLFYLVRKAAPTEPTFTGALILVTMASIGAFGIQFLCKNDQALHLVVWHFLPIVFLAVAGAALGRRFLRW